MRIAFHAPLKPPGHAQPSGDRRMARLLMAALERAGHTVEVASVLRSYDGGGDRDRQRRLRILGERMAARLVRRWGGNAPDLWFTYHLYYKAPDWIGPAVSDALAIPYVLAEVSHAPKREGGPWALGHEEVAAAIARAHRVFGLNPVDAGCVLPLLAEPGRYVELKPFLDVAPYRTAIARDLGLDASGPRLLAVAMMRPGDKLASYRVLGEALGLLKDKPWSLLVAGDGPARPEVEAALAGLAGRVTWLGEQTPEALAALYAAADVYVWPAVNEAYGMAFLEAQASGLPVVAGRTGGVPGIVRDGTTGMLVPMGDAAAFAGAVGALLDNAGERRRMGEAARRVVATEHGIDGAARALDLALRSLKP
jgi:glycosyltransferase involved in cell wall biosynthesis